MPDGADRREARRFNMTLPMKVLSLDSNSSELKAYTRDVSYRGLYFLSEGEFKLGWIGDVQLSDDGRKVFYRAPAVFFPDRYEYDVVSGTLRKVEWTQPKHGTPAPCGGGSDGDGFPDATR